MIVSINTYGERQEYTGPVSREWIRDKVGDCIARRLPRGRLAIFTNPKLPGEVNLDASALVGTTVRGLCFIIHYTDLTNSPRVDPKPVA